jgi:hypothetical protein
VKKSLLNKRPNPAFLSFAADFIADETYREASAAERGLAWSLMNYCWVNGDAPADAEGIARHLSLSPEDAGRIDCNLVKKHFERTGDPKPRLACPELKRQRKAKEEHSRIMSDAGARGGRSTQERARGLSQASSLAKAGEMNRNEMKGKEAPLERSVNPRPEEHAAWIADFDSASNYRAASRGR